MKIEVVQETPAQLDEYASIPIWFEVDRVMEVTRTAGGLTLDERSTTRRMKDYDAIPGEGPASWPKRFDMSDWSLFAARADGVRVGAAAVVARTNAIQLLEGRSDLALLWDLRVAPAMRGKGVGSALLGAVELWARGERIRTVKVETQDVNAAACRFYLHHGFELRSATPHAYRDFPDETRLLWYKDIDPGTVEEEATWG